MFDVLKYVTETAETYNTVPRSSFRGGQLVQPGPGRPGYAGTGGGKQESLKVLNYLETLPKDTELSIQDIVEWSKKNKTEVGISSLYKNLNTPERLASPDLKKRWQNVNKKLKINIRPQFTLAPTEENFKKLGKLLKDKSLTKDDIKKSFGLKPKTSTESFNKLLKAYEKSREVKIPDTRFKPYRHKGTELAEKIVKTFKGDDTMTVTALTEKFFPGRPEQRKSVIKILKEANVRQPQPIKKISGPKTIEQIMSKRRRDKIKEKSVPAYEKKIRGTKNTHLHHMMSKRFNVTTSNLGYAPPRVNAELLPKVEGVLDSLYKKRENLLRKKPANWRKQLEDINVRGMNIVSDPKVKGYLNFKIMDPKTLKMRDHGVNIAKTIDPAGLLEGKAIKDLTQADKDLIELNRAAVMKKQKGPPIKSAIPRTSLYSFPANLENPKFLAKEAIEGGKLVGKGLGKTFRTLGTPIAGPAFAAWTASDKMKAGESLADAVIDPLTGAELALPTMFKENLSKIAKSPTARKILGLGKFGTRFLGPIGWGIAGAGAVRDAYKDYQRRKPFIEQMRADPDYVEPKYDTNFEVYANGGIAGLSGGKRFGPPPESGPMPQGGGLSSQFNRVRKLTG